MLLGAASGARVALRRAGCRATTMMVVAPLTFSVKPSQQNGTAGAKLTRSAASAPQPLAGGHRHVSQPPAKLHQSRGTGATGMALRSVCLIGRMPRAPARHPASGGLPWTRHPPSLWRALWKRRSAPTQPLVGASHNNNILYIIYSNS